MRIAVTGASGFIGRYVVQHLTDLGHTCRCWFRAGSNLEGIAVDPAQLEWITGELGDLQSAQALVDRCDAVVHAALYHPGGGFHALRSGLGDFVEKNVLGTLQLIEVARGSSVPRFIFVSSCAVHEEILTDRPLDETHPLWPKSHYGAHKAAIEMFVHSFGLGEGYEICALRPTGVYGLAYPVEKSKWFDLVRSVVQGNETRVEGGGKEVHVADVARAVAVLLTTDGIAGQAYNCYDTYISQYDVAMTAKAISGSAATVVGESRQPVNQIRTDKLRELGMTFGGWPAFEATIGELVSEIQGE